MRRRPIQIEIPFKSWGGRRRGAGRPRASRRAGVPHQKRPRLASRFPVHVSLKIRREVGSIRNKQCHRVIREAFIKSRREGFRVCHYSVQKSHIHLVVEAHSARDLSRGIQGMNIRIARGINRVLGRKGKVFADRFFARILRTPREVRNCLGYVLNNWQRHKGGRAKGWRELTFDPFSNASTFDGWKKKASTRTLTTGPPAVAEPHTWLLSTGWRRRGLLVPAYVRQIEARL